MTTILIPIAIVAVIGLIAAIILTILSKILFVPVDETQAAIREVLPGANCGACGFAGCDDYAGALAKDHTLSTTLCTPGAAAVAEAIAGILGVEAGAVDPKVAFVMCGGNKEVTDTIMTYEGVKTCKAAKQFFGGQWSCTYGCLGLGDCRDVCQYGAIRIVDGLAVINRDLCVGCGMCEKACPNGIITIASKKSLVYVKCNSHDPGAQTRKACSVGCIGCGKCAKTCKFDAITVENGLAKIDFEKCKNCGLCEKECPTHAIANLRKKPAPKAMPEAAAQTKQAEDAQAQTEAVGKEEKN